jgi:hypothetical protein
MPVLTVGGLDQDYGSKRQRIPEIRNKSLSLTQLVLSQLGTEYRGRWTVVGGRNRHRSQRWIEAGPFRDGEHSHVSP